MGSHEHCFQCINLVRCRRQSSKIGSKCALWQCHLNCGATYHACKEDEHRLLCPKEKVSCINVVYGCPLMVERRNRGRHLHRCPASVVHCTMTFDHCPVPLVTSIPSMAVQEKELGNRKVDVIKVLNPDTSPVGSLLRLSSVCEISASVSAERQRWKTFESFTLNPSQRYTFTCAKNFQRGEFAWHFRNVHTDLQSCLYEWVEQWCPMAQYGCKYTRQRLAPNVKLPSSRHPGKEDETEQASGDENPQVVFHQHLQAFGVLHHHNGHHRRVSKGLPNGTEAQEPVKALPVDVLTRLPSEVLLVIASHLDSFSLNNLSLTSKRLRSVCQSLLSQRGIVLPQWQKTDNSSSWHIARFRWQFSVAFEPIPGWRMSNLPPLAVHMSTCPYYATHLRSQGDATTQDRTPVQVMGPAVREFCAFRQKSSAEQIPVVIRNYGSESLKAKMIKKFGWPLVPEETSS